MLLIFAGTIGLIIYGAEIGHEKLAHLKVDQVSLGPMQVEIGTTSEVLVNPDGAH